MYILHVHEANDIILRYIKTGFDRMKGRIVKPYSPLGHYLFIYFVLLGYFACASHILIEAAKIQDLRIPEICHSQQIPVNQICTRYAL